MVDKDLRAGKNVYAGLFLISLATLTYEILLTRIFSVTMWYHFAFLSISIVMFGMTIGAILVYLMPGYFSQDKTEFHLGLSAFLCSITTVLSFLLYLLIPFVNSISVLAFVVLAFTYVLISIPFIFSGICVCLALTRFPAQVSKLYAIDLLGAGIGCMLLVYLLKLTDGPTAVIIVAFLTGLASILFLHREKAPGLFNSAIILVLILGIFSAGNSYLAGQQKPILRLIWVKGGITGLGLKRPIYEKWSSFSYISIRERQSLKPFGWGISENYDKNEKVRQLILTIDGSASTPITNFDGDFSKLQYLKYDLTNLVYYLRPDASVLVLGAGGGRDVLSALSFGAKSVRAVEMNADIIKALNQRFGDFSGHLDRIPGVRFVNAEGRSYVASSKENFDIIQVSLIDTWAATAAGAFILSEHSLYTVEAWKDFLSHLSKQGILSFSYWYTPEKFPAVIYRMVSLANTSLQEMGVKNPREHIIIVRHIYKLHLSTFPEGVATILISRDPFSSQDIAKIKTLCEEMNFEMVLGPDFSLNPVFEAVASGKTLEQFPEFSLLNIKPTRDDSPFFFYALKFQNAFKPGIWKAIEKTSGVGPPLTIFILGALLIITLGLTFLFILVPLALTADKSSLRGSLWFFVFFIAIGFGFMLIEISQMQRLIIFLGHPTYGLSVVLFTILISSGIGSFLTGKLKDQMLKKYGVILLIILLILLIIFGFISPYLVRFFRSSETMLRIFIAGAMLFPVGIFMGMPFPLGIRIASQKSPSLTPWLWGINGAISVCASVIAVVIALNFSLSITFWIGFCFYSLCLLAFASAKQKPA